MTVADCQYFFVEEELPLKQGLKLHTPNARRRHDYEVEEELPLKQGLKRKDGLPRRNQTRVEEELPLKQGLKLCW